MLSNITYIKYKIRSYWIKKKKAIIIANCQGQALYTLLKNTPVFTNEYELIHVQPIHLLNDSHQSFLLKTISDIDLFIHQPISENYGIYATEALKKLLKPTARSISFPVVYFNGYNPETVYLKNPAGKKLSLSMDYHDLNIMKMFIDEYSIEETVSNLHSEHFYTPEILELNWLSSLQTLKGREKNLDIQVSEYIEQHFKTHRLFFSMNHPSNELLFEIIKQLFTLLQLETAIQSFPKQLLGKTRLFIYPSLKQHFNIMSEEKIIIENQSYSLEKYIEKCFTEYRQHRDIIDFNIAQYAKSNDLIKEKLASRIYS